MLSNCTTFLRWRVKIPASLATGEVPVVTNNVWPVLFWYRVVYQTSAHNAGSIFNYGEKRNTKSSFPTGQNSFHSNREMENQCKRNQYKHRKKKKEIKHRTCNTRPICIRRQSSFLLTHPIPKQGQTSHRQYSCCTSALHKQQTKCLDDLHLK